MVLIPQYLSRQKFLLYSILLLVVLVLCSLNNILFFNILIDYILPGYYFISYYSFFDVFKFFFVLALSSTLLKLSREWFQLIESKQKIVEIEKEKVEIELKALKAQINPHFLFNSLNVLYSLALKKADESPELILKLSDILRYVIYDSNNETVKLKSEVDLINNYLSLQKHRIDDSSNISFQTDIKKNSDISPMLFLPLVENSFKHGIKGDISNTFIDMKLSSTNEMVHFEIENNKGKADKQSSNEEGGIGLINIKKRLNLIYPDRHELNIDDSEKEFKVILKINL